MRDTELMLDSLLVGINRLGTNAELLPDLDAAVALGHETDRQLLTTAQRFERLTPNVGGAATSHGPGE